MDYFKHFALVYFVLITCTIFSFAFVAPNARFAVLSVVPNMLPPSVNITSPTSGASFAAPATITIDAAASDSDGTISKVEFFQGATKLGEDTTAPYSYTWNTVAAGTYQLTAKATDNLGATSTSSVVNITVSGAPPPPVGSGTGLNGEYYDNLDFTLLKLTRTDTTVNFDWGTGSPDATIGGDTYSVRWTGQVEARYSENHTFYTTSDDGVRLWVDGQLLINNWTGHPPTENTGTITLTAGQRYNVRLEYFEDDGGAVAKLSWSSASQAKQIIAQTQLYATVGTPPPSGTGTGLKGEYYDNMDFTLLKVTRTDPTINFNWVEGSPDATLGPETFSVRWTGQVQPRYSESYTFYTVSDDGVRLWVNGQLVINNWTDHAPVENAGTITLVAGQRYDIRLEYYENGGGALVQMLWSSTSQPKQIIPQTQLYISSGP